MSKQDLDFRSNASRRQFLKSTAVASALALARPVNGLSGAMPGATARAMPEEGSNTLPAAFSALKPLGSRVHPITADEFHQRMVHAQKLMSELTPKYDALFVAPATSLGDRGIRTGRVGVEETAAFTFFDHLRGVAPGLECVSADAVTIACRGRKSAHELELMRLACEATFDVFRAVFASLKEGMSQEDIGKLVEGGFSKMS